MSLYVMDQIRTSRVHIRIMKIEGTYDRTVNDILTIDKADEKQVELVQYSCI